MSLQIFLNEGVRFFWSSAGYSERRFEFSFSSELYPTLEKVKRFLLELLSGMQGVLERLSQSDLSQEKILQRRNFKQKDRVDMTSQVSRTDCAKSFPLTTNRPGNFSGRRVELPSAVSQCSRQLRPALAKIQVFFPELLRVMQEILGEPIRICLSGENFLARWDFKLKEIAIGKAHFNRRPDWYSFQDILFEMQNACYTDLFAQLKKDAPTLSCPAYVRRVEEIEWSTCKLTCARIESLPEEEFSIEANEFLTSYVEDFELHYLHQQTSGHSFKIADHYCCIEGLKDVTSYQGTWKRPFGRDDRSRKVLYDLLVLHLKILRSGEGEDKLRKSIQIIESWVEEQWAEDVLVNLKWFSEKFEASPHFSNSKVPLYKPDRDKLELLGIFD